jgi:isoleucyl-tRNA synthetase
LAITSDAPIRTDPPEIFAGEGQIASVGADLTVVFKPARGQKCDRCWRVLPEVGQSHAHPTLCRRCESVVEGLTT